ncbi:hypothetical protein VNO77_19671 [Canavalia gladiata]|uniref:Uncharacterized protein n=1 Tax=Canavalia gladiata TaxID=3824 RepID=A0AAN9LN78_CANGL
MTKTETQNQNSQSKPTFQVAKTSLCQTALETTWERPCVSSSQAETSYLDHLDATSWNSDRRSSSQPQLYTVLAPREGHIRTPIAGRHAYKVKVKEPSNVSVSSSKLALSVFQEGQDLRFSFNYASGWTSLPSLCQGPSGPIAYPQLHTKNQNWKALALALSQLVEMLNYDDVRTRPWQCLLHGTPQVMQNLERESAFRERRAWETNERAGAHAGRRGEIHAKVKEENAKRKPMRKADVGPFIKATQGIEILPFNIYDLAHADYKGGEAQMVERVVNNSCVCGSSPA